jgi:hypothetical protein
VVLVEFIVNNAKPSRVLDLDTRLRWLHNFSLRPLYPRYPLDKRLGVPHMLYGRCGIEENTSTFCPYRESNSVFQSASAYLTTNVWLHATWVLSNWQWTGVTADNNVIILPGRSNDICLHVIKYVLRIWGLCCYGDECQVMPCPQHVIMLTAPVPGVWRHGPPHQSMSHEAAEFFSRRVCVQVPLLACLTNIWIEHTSVVRLSVK